MAGIVPVRVLVSSIYSEWVRPFLTLFLTATLFNASALAESKTINDGEFQKLLLKAENGSLSAQVRVAKAYALGQSGQVDYEAAAHWYRKAADQGDPDSQTNLGVLYTQGHGVPRDDAEAMRWFERAVASGYSLAQHNLGIMILNGWGVPRDPQRGLELMMRAASAGLGISQVQIGLAYMNGQVVPRDPELAMKWLKRASRQGLSSADLIMGVMYENGDGAQQNYGKAAELYRKAADMGLAGAQNNLGRLYLAGQGVRQNKAEAARLFLLAAQQGNMQSYLNLALCSLKGCQNVIDPVAAYGWYLAAAHSGIPIPQTFPEKFKQVAAQLTPEQIKAAESASLAWTTQHPTPDARTPVELNRVPDTAVAMNRQKGSPNPNEVIRNLWPQNLFMQQALPMRSSNRDSVQ